MGAEITEEDRQIVGQWTFMPQKWMLEMVAQARQAARDAALEDAKAGCAAHKAEWPNSAVVAANADAIALRLDALKTSTTNTTGD